MANVARWTEAAGLRGLLVFTDNSEIDPWAAAQFLVERTRQLVPLVAAQPMYMHPYNAARMVSSIAHLYGRRVDLNLVTGGSRPDFQAVGCELGHDERYHRLVEFARVVGGLLEGPGPVTHHGVYYRLDGAQLRPAMVPELLPRYYLAGSSPASAAAAGALGVARLSYPRRPDEYPAGSPLSGSGIRLGIIARDTGDEAWRVAWSRYPRDRLGEVSGRLAARGAEPQWWHALMSAAREQHGAVETYWLYPFQSAKAYCPFLVGSHAEVGAILSRYLALGVTTVILAAPRVAADLYHARLALDQAQHPSVAGSG